MTFPTLGERRGTRNSRERGGGTPAFHSQCACGLWDESRQGRQVFKLRANSAHGEAERWRPRRLARRRPAAAACSSRCICISVPSRQLYGNAAARLRARATYTRERSRCRDGHASAARRRRASRRDAGVPLSESVRASHNTSATAVPSTVSSALFTESDSSQLLLQTLLLSGARGLSQAFRKVEQLSPLPLLYVDDCFDHSTMALDMSVHPNSAALTPRWHPPSCA